MRLGGESNPGWSFRLTALVLLGGGVVAVGVGLADAAGDLLGG